MEGPTNNPLHRFVDEVQPIPLEITCQRSLGVWEVRLNGRFLIDFGWFGAEKRARRAAMNLTRLLALAADDEQRRRDEEAA